MLKSMGDWYFTFSNFKYLINKYGKTNKQIAEEVKRFVYKGSDCSNNIENCGKEIKPKFYGYYADYDWVVVCWLFRKMIDLPSRFPMYCVDLKQELDRIQEFYVDRYKAGSLKDFANYPKQTNEHNALADARWNFELFKFLEKL